MEREIIETMTASIPHSPTGREAKDHEIWEEIDGGARFSVTRHRLPGAEQYEGLFLVVSGESEERARVIDEFVAVFGDPIETDFETGESAVDTVCWLVEPS